jgi:DNA-binding transcriptional regulator YiaG
MPAKPEAASNVLAAVYETASDLHDAGFIDMLSMKQYDALCLTSQASQQPRQRIPKHVRKPRPSGG